MRSIRPACRACIGGLRAAAGCLAVCLVPACSLPDPPADREPGKFTVIFTNTSGTLVNALLATLPDPDNTLTWAVPVAPNTWDSLVLDCDVETVLPVGALVASSLDGTDPVEISFNEPPFTRNVDFGCGSVIAIEFESTAESEDEESPEDVVVSGRTVNRGSLSVSESENGPGADTGLVVVRASAPRGVPARVNVAWEGADGLIFRSSISFGGRETFFGFLLTCPVSRFTVGDFEEGTIEAGLLTETGDVLAAPPALDLSGLSCGGSIEIELVESAGEPGYALTLNADNDPSATNRMYDDVRAFLDEVDLYDRPSNLFALLPPSIVTQEGDE